ncbi:hypothetical protein AAHE18_09G056000 [Arachis hypogaea]
MFISRDLISWNFTCNEKFILWKGRRKHIFVFKRTLKNNTFPNSNNAKLTNRFLPFHHTQRRQLDQVPQQEWMQNDQYRVTLHPVQQAHVVLLIYYYPIY